MSWFAFLGDFTVVAAGIIAYAQTGSWSVLVLGAVVLLALLILLSGNRKAPAAARRGKKERK